ncbi:MAG: hypothetical protein NZ989_08875 [Bacteroidia bacterium]|nr:hypothetical protein [Bacteroidia bacterium]MDW8058425.1 hypothetical protein [Bacteroidia bacterium]
MLPEIHLLKLGILLQTFLPIFPQVIYDLLEFLDTPFIHNNSKETIIRR